MTTTEPSKELNSDMVADQLKALGAELISVADDQIARKSKLLDLERFLGRLTVKDFPDLAESPIIQSFVRLFANTDGLKPGQVRNRGTLAEFGREWTWDDACREFPLKTFIPIVSVPITWNGVGPVYLQQEMEITVPQPFWNIYREQLFARKQADLHINYIMGKSNVAPHPNWLTDNSAKLRAQATFRGPTGQPGAFYIPGGGLIQPRAGGETEANPAEEVDGATG